MDTKKKTWQDLYNAPDLAKIPVMTTKNNPKRRRLQTFGLFAPSVCKGRALDSGAEKEIYIGLKGIGFKETRWQFIFEGQKAGLVLPYDDGKYEVHIRFYEDRIFAEFEVGRSSLAHFLGPFLNANHFVISSLRGSLSSENSKVLREMMSLNRLLLEERRLAQWDHGSSKVGAFRHGVSREGKRGFSNFDTATVISSMLSWRRLNFIAGIATAASLMHIFGLQSGLISMSAFFVLSAFLPRVGQP